MVRNLINLLLGKEMIFILSYLLDYIKNYWIVKFVILLFIVNVLFIYIFNIYLKFFYFYEFVFFFFYL